MLDRDIHQARALLVESNALLRSVTAGQLRDLGIGHVQSSMRVKDARLLLERERFDIVICNLEFEGSDYSGQDLLDELRREHQLPLSTVFLMVTGNASYHQVVEAAEASLDGFLVRPFTAAALGVRLLEARNRKRELADVLRALDAGDNEVALVRAVKRFQEQQPYWQYCGRLAAELLLGLQRPQDARRIFERLLQAKPDASWARLGMARAQLAAGDQGGARKAIAEVLRADAGSAEAHDLMGRLLIDRCDFDGALTEYLSAAALTPGCLVRCQLAGALAFYQGQADDAMKWLERALNMGSQSKLFDPLSLLLLALLHFDRGDDTRVAAMGAQLRRWRERQPDRTAEPARLQRMQQSTALLGLLLGTEQEQIQALDSLRVLTAQVVDADFDLEAAELLLALWARVPEAVRPAAEHEAAVQRVGTRCCTSKASGEVLVAAARRAEPALGSIRHCQARVATLVEQAMELSMRGDPHGAAAQLLTVAEQTLNTRLLDVAESIMRRHQHTIADAAAALQARAADVLRRSGPPAGHIAGIQRPRRTPGNLQVRAKPAEVVADPA